MMNKNSESFNIARHQYIRGYQDKKELIFPTLDLVAKEISLIEFKEIILVKYRKIMDAIKLS